MLIDCAGCVMRDIACGDCVVTVLLGPAQSLEPAEQAAVAVLAEGGLVPPLRLVPGRTAERVAAERVAGRAGPPWPGERPRSIASA